MDVVSFEQLGLSAELVRAVEEMGFTKPTPIQVAAIPAALEGRDVLASAMTGSGKTAAFLLPILERIRLKPRGVTRVLILTPTRELAAQTVDALKELAKHTRVRGAAVYGGVGMGPQIEAFKRGADIIVATPGRLLDHFGRDYGKLNGLEVLVIDEADRMLDMGFLPDIRRVLNHLPRTPRQTLFFSATMPAPIVELSRELLRNPQTVNVQRKSAPATGVAQAFYPVPSHLKVELVSELLRRGDIGNAIVFCRTKHRANRLAERLEKSGFGVARIHGNRSQSQRTEALAGFKEGRYRVLVATDIVARGIDVEALDHVVNFDVPNSPADYIHRVGRTARAEATGDAYTLYSPDEESGVLGIDRAIGRKIERRRIEGFDYTKKAEARFEVPVAERLAAMRARKSEERARSKEKTERRSKHETDSAGRPTGKFGSAPRTRASVGTRERDRAQDSRAGGVQRRGGRSGRA